MSWPEITVEIAFASAPFSGVDVWEDVSDYVVGFNSKRGRNYELARIDAGTLDVTLDNSDGRFTPEKPDSPYYPNVIPRRKIRVASLWDGVTYSIWTGYIESWPVTFPGGGDVSQVQVKAVDGFKHLGGVELKTVYAEEVNQSSPIAYFPLGEPEGSAYAQDQAKGYVAAVKTSKYGTGTLTFGTDMEGAIKGGEGTAVTFTPPAGQSKAGKCLQTSPIPGIGSDDGHTFTATLECFVTSTVDAVADSSDVHGGGRTLMSLSTEGARGTIMAVEIDTLGRVCGIVGISKIISADITGTGLHHVVYTLSITPSGGTHNYSGAMYVDGVQIGTGTGTVGTPGKSPILNIGGMAGPYETGNFFSGVISHVGVYNRVLPIAESTRHGDAGVNAFKFQNESERIERILAYVGWPPDDLDLEQGLTSLEVYNNTGQTAVEALQANAEDASGVVFMNGAGQVVYHNRYHRINNTDLTVFDGSTDTGVEDDFELTSDDTYIINDVQGERPNGIPARATDQTSIDRYGRRVDELKPNITSDLELADAVNWRLFRYKAAAIRCPSVSILPVTSDALWPSALGLEIGDRCRVASLPASAPATSMDFFIESIAHDVNSETMTWRTTFEVSPVPKDEGWVLGSSLLGISTRLIY